MIVGSALLLAALLGVLGLRVAALANQVTGDVSQGRTALIEGAQILKSGGGITKSQVSVATADFTRAETHFQQASTVLQHSRLVGLANFVPGVSRQVEAARRLADIGVHASRAGQIGTQALDSVLLGEASRGPAVGPGQKVLDLLEALNPKLDAIDSELNVITGDRTMIPSSGLVAPLAKAVADFDSKLKLNTVKATIAAIRSDEEPLKHLLGADGASSYLVLQQDPAELRATGGFIGGVGFLSFDHGKMAPYQPVDVYDIDGHDPYGNVLGPNGSPKHVEPPAPMVTTFRLKSWTLRDSNWSPDMPTAARQAEFFLNLEAGKKVDGVIAVDPFFISKILSVIGPVKVPETGDTVDAGNFFSLSLLRVDIQSGHGPGKKFLSYASKAIFARLVSSPPKEFYALMQALQAACGTRSVQAYFHDPLLEDFVARNDCSGQLRPLKGDGVMIVDSNISGTKDDFWLKRHFDLRLDVQPNGTIRHTLRLHYDGLSPHDNLTGTWGYTGWLRIYLPPSATLVSATGGRFDVTTDLGRRVLQGWLYVKFDSRTDITLVYDIDAPSLHASNGHLDFLWQKQAGRVSDPISVELSLPEEWKLRSDQIGSSKLNNAKIASDLSIDREFAFDYLSP